MRSRIQFTIFALGLLSAAPCSFAADIPTRDTFSDTWTATDELGRTLPDNTQCGNPRPDKYVAMFYFLWLNHKPGQRVYDISQILKQPIEQREWGPKLAFHYWSQPWLGYYDSGDERAPHYPLSAINYQLSTIIYHLSIVISPKSR